MEQKDSSLQCSTWPLTYMVDTVVTNTSGCLNVTVRMSYPFRVRPLLSLLAGRLLRVHLAAQEPQGILHLPLVREVQQLLPPPVLQGRQCPLVAL